MGLSILFTDETFTGRDSISTTASDYDLPDCSNAYFPFSYESISESLGLTAQELDAPYAEDQLPSGSNMSSDVPVRPPSPVLPMYSDHAIPVTPSRRSSFAQSPITSPDGHLCPPVASPVRSHGRSRAKTMLDVPSGYNDMRIIPTVGFGANSGVMTSVLVPMPAQHYEQDLQRDLEEYRTGLESVTASESTRVDGGPLFSSFQLAQQQLPSSKAGVASGMSKVPMGRRQSLDDGDLDLNAEFDFDAEFGDIIDIHPPRARSGTA
jgi:hypothetical protein